MKVRVLPGIPYAPLAQRLEHLVYTEGVVGSNPTGSTIYVSVAERLGTGLQTQSYWFNSNPGLHIRPFSSAVRALP
jgi:hypothetical protein